MIYINSFKSAKGSIYIFHPIIFWIKTIVLVTYGYDSTICQVVRQQQTCDNIHLKEISLTLTTITNTAAGWLKIVHITYFDLDEVSSGNKRYIDK